MLVIAGCLVTASSMASITGVFGVVPVHAGAVPVHSGSPPPVAVAVLVAVVAVEATFTGTVMTIGPAAPVAIEQPAKLAAPAAPAVVQLPAVNVPPVTLMPALVVMPAGKVSFRVMAAVVGPFATAMLMV